MGAAGSLYELKTSGTGLEIRFSSSMDRIDDVCTAVTLFLRSLGDLFSPHIFAVNLVIREGLTNAVRHGNQNDPGKVVDFSLTVDSGRIRVRIADEGNGFDWQDARSGSLAEDADHGRGVPIMDTYFDRCQYNQKGNILYLEKEIAAEV